MRHLIMALIICFVSFASATEVEQLLDNKIIDNQDNQLIFSEQELLWIKENPNVSVIGSPNWFPFEGFDEKGEYQGIVAEVLNLIAHKSSLTFNVIAGESWGQVVKLGPSSGVDIISGSRANADIEKLYRPTYSTIKNPIVMIARENMPYVVDLSSVKNLRIALQRNAGYSHVIRENHPDINFINVDYVEDGLLGIADEQYDIMLLSMSVASYQLAELGLYELRVVGITDVDMELTLFVRRDKPVLWDIINKVKLHESKQERHEILAKWIKNTYVGRFSPELIRALILVFIGVIGFILYRNRLLKKQAKLLIELAQTDKLTNIHNRLYLDKMLKQYQALYQRYQTPFSLMMIDIDYFKEVNDKFGHLIGDKLLKHFVLLLQDNIRNSDVLGRWGGEEFLIICPKTELPDALLLAEKLRKIVADTIFLEVGKKTASFGVSEYQQDESVEACLSRADRALYLSKESGRNAVHAESFTH